MLQLIKNPMRNIKIFNVTPTGTLLFEDNSSLREGSLEGFHIDTSIRSRHIFWTLMGSQVECCVTKHSKIKYRQIDILTKMISLGVLTINPQEMTGSDLFLQQEKQGFCSAEKSDQDYQMIDLVNNRELLPKLHESFLHAQGEIVYLEEDIIVRINCAQKVVYLPLKLERIDHFFQLQKPKSLAKFINENIKTSVQVRSPKFNLAKNRYECQATMSSQFEKEILRNGWGRVCVKNISRINPTIINEYKRIENMARQTHQGIFNKPTDLINLMFTKHTIFGRVEQVIEGFIFLIRLNDNTSIRFSLQKVSCPIQNEVGAFQCREFARKNLIGRQVNILNNKSSSTSPQGSLVRNSDNKDIESLLLENGYAFINEQLKGSMETVKLEHLEAKVKQKRVGIYSSKVGNSLYQKFTASHRHMEKLVKHNMIEAKKKYLKSVNCNTDCVIESIIDTMTYVVRIDCDRKYIRIKLDGVEWPSLSTALKEVAAIRQYAKEFIFRNFNQRNAKMTLTDYNPVSNSFIGVLSISSQHRSKKKSLQKILLEEGLVYLTGFFEQSWVESEEEAKKKGVNIWQKKLQPLTRSNLFESQAQEFSGKVSWLENGYMAFIQPNSVKEQLDEVHEQINNSTLPKLENMRVGQLCAVEYEGEYYRARILGIQKQKTAIFFIDWGNKEQRSLQYLYEIPSRLHYLPPLCCEVNLDFIKPIKKAKTESETLLTARELLMDSEVRIRKIDGRTVQIFMGSKNMNKSLVEEGLLKADLSQIQDETVRNGMHNIMQDLRKQLVGIWEFNESGDEDEEADMYESDWIIM